MGVRWQRLGVARGPEYRDWSLRSVMPTPMLLGFVLLALSLQVLLLPLFGASGECCIPPPLPPLPRMVNGIDLRDGPALYLHDDSLVLDWERFAWPSELGDVDPLAGSAAGFDTLVSALERQRELWQSFHPSHPPVDNVLLFVDQELPAAKVKAVVQACAEAGFPSIDFVGVALPK
jgi:hypothetical protein